MSVTTPRLIHMANQIGQAFRTQGVERARRATFEHIWQFWDPWMRNLIVEHLDAGGAGLNDIARGAVSQLAERLRATS